VFGDPYSSWLIFSVMARIPVVFAGAAGILIYLWPGLRPVRRTFLFVVIPALLGFGAICARFFQVMRDPNFPPASTWSGSHGQLHAWEAIWSLGPALHVIVVGLGLVLIFWLRMVLGASSLPASLESSLENEANENKAWRALVLFIWIAMVSAPVFDSFSDLAFAGIYSLAAKMGRAAAIMGASSTVPYGAMSAALSTIWLTAAAIWIVGKAQWMELRQFFRIPRFWFLLLGTLLPIGIYLTPSLVAYISERIRWASVDFGKFEEPVFSSYFYYPAPRYLWYLVAAALEEVIWRGYLQPRFVRRYGILRGIFLLGLLWSAFHFWGDFYHLTADDQILKRLAQRLAFCISTGYVYGWLALQSRSVWPATLAHGITNAWAFSIHDSFADLQNPTLSIVIISFAWVALAVALFHFWPPADDAGDDTFLPVQEIQGAAPA